MASQESFVRAEGDFRLALLFFPLLVCGSVHGAKSNVAHEGSANADDPVFFQEAIALPFCFSVATTTISFCLVCCVSMIQQPSFLGDVAALQIFSCTATLSSLADPTSWLVTECADVT